MIEIKKFELYKNLNYVKFDDYYWAKSLLIFNFLSLLLLTILLILFYYFYKIYNKEIFLNYKTSFSYLKFLLIFFLIISFFLHMLFIWFYVKLVYSYFNDVNNLYNFLSYSLFLDYNFFNKFITFYFSVDFFGIILLTLAYLVGFISLLVLDTRLYWKNTKYFFSFHIFLLIVYLYTTTSNLLLFFLFYEFLLIPSFLFVYFVSPSRRAIQASLYFVIWTQIGSFLVFCSCVYIISLVGTTDFFYIKKFKFNSFESTLIYTLLFFGFGFKVPIWPFHYWLTKTHVEAPSGFSIYLSGFLVKSALYGFYKLSNLLSFDINTTIFLIICFFGVLDSSLKMWGQTDLKKLIAYGTIQEMNLIYLVFCWGDSNSIIVGILFSATHAFLSGLMFFIVDCLYRRYHTRSLVEVNGILHINPNLGISIILMCVFFAGLPGTIKFISEFYLFSGLLESSLFICFFLMFIANVLGLIGFSKCWFNAIFGLNKNYFKVIPMDLTFKELGIIIFCLYFLLFFSFFISIFF